MQTCLVIFHIQDRALALPAARVVQIVRMVAVTPIPDAPSGVLGVINVRGAITPVMDLQICLGLPPHPPHLNSRILLTQIDSTILGLIADSVSEVISIPSTQIEDARPPFDANALVTQFARIEHRLIQILNLERLGAEIGTLSHDA